MTEEKTRIRAVGKCFAVLEALCRHGEAGPTVLAADLEMSKSTVHNYLATLEADGYVRGADGTYRVSPRLLYFGGRACQDLPIYRFGRASVDRLADMEDALGTIAVRDGLEALVVYVAGSHTLDGDGFPLGARVALHSSALGKVLLATAEPAVRNDVLSEKLPAYTEETMTDPDAIRAELDEIRENGVAFDDMEQDPDLRSVAAPVFDEDGSPAGAVGLTQSVDTWSQEYVESECTGVVYQTAQQVEMNVGYKQWPASVEE
jgi:DNA-binding IclR family transcriptional regulator